MASEAAAARDLDLVFWGATGFTGRLSVAAMAGHAASFYSCHLPNVGSPRGGGKVRYALAGRDEAKLRQVHAECGCGSDVDVFVAGADDEAALAAFVSRTKVVVALAGPFKFHSDVVVGLCARLGTHYVDITGEVAWVRSVIDRYDDVARSTGALICNCCGFDSVPFDLGAQFAINRLRVRGTASSIRRVSAYSVMGGPSGPGMLISGGTLTSGASNQGQAVQLTKGVDRDDPFLLGGLPKGGARDEDTDASTHVVRKLGESLYCGPSMMHSVNSRLVRRSARLLEWGPAFNFTEVMPVPSERAAEKLVKQASAPAPPEVVERLMAAGRLPKPGEGPLPDVRKLTRFVTVLECMADDGSSLVATVRGGEAGYEEASRMVLEAGLALVEEPHLCPGVATGGCLTTAAAFGETLIRRLDQVGITFAVESQGVAAVVSEVFRAGVERVAAAGSKL